MSNDNRFQPASDPKLFYRQVRAGVLEPQPYLCHNHWYSVKDLLILNTLFFQGIDQSFSQALMSIGVFQ